MWSFLANFIIRYRIILLLSIASLTAFMAYQASKVQMSYDFTNAIPTDNPKYRDFQQFLETFGNDANVMMIGIQSDRFFEPDFFNSYVQLSQNIQQVKSVEAVLDIPHSVNIIPDSIHKLNVAKLFAGESFTTSELDSLSTLFKGLPFYKGLLYNPDSNVYLMAITINKNTLASADRTRVINEITDLGDQFGEQHKIEMHYSGLPFIRTQTANKIQYELRLFLILSFVLTALILFLFFRSFTAVWVSMLIVAIGVVCSVGTLVLLGYEITLLTGVIPPLVVVIGIPNCVYFLNKYHTEFELTKSKIPALKGMISKMGIVTLFTNLTSAIGFGVFFFTKSVILKEFGLVAGINIIGLFIISLILIPAIYSFLPSPTSKHIRYLDNKWLNRVLDALVELAFKYRKFVYVLTIAICGFSIYGMTQLKAIGHIVDDLPHSDRVYQDLVFFENHFKGVMPLEIILDTKKKYGALTSLDTWEAIDELNEYLEQRPEIGGGLTLTKGVKFARQGLMGGDISDYRLPDRMEFNALRPYLISTLRKQNLADTSAVAGIFRNFVDTNLQYIRLSVNVADIGSVEMPYLLKDIEQKADSLFDKDKHALTLTGTSITFLEGSRFIIFSLRDSLILAFAMILLCMIILFRGWRIVLIAFITNLIPIILTAGLMGWLHVPLKPSTVLVFSVALGITVDVTIRFLVNFKQDIEANDEPIRSTVKRSIRDTGTSIIFTTLILIAGFGVFAVSDFQGTKFLGYLTSLTLLLAMVFNLTLLPALLLWLDKTQRAKRIKELKKTNGR